MGRNFLISIRMMVIVGSFLATFFVLCHFATKKIQEGLQILLRWECFGRDVAT
jgi:hypothetical protein